MSHCNLLAGNPHDLCRAMCFYWNETLHDAAAYADIRLLHSVGSGWISSASSNATLSSFSAVCYYFARALKQLVPAYANLPIGLVQVSWYVRLTHLQYGAGAGPAAVRTTTHILGFPGECWRHRDRVVDG